MNCFRDFQIRQAQDRLRTAGLSFKICFLLHDCGPFRRRSIIFLFRPCCSSSVRIGVISRLAESLPSVEALGRAVAIRLYQRHTTTVTSLGSICFNLPADRRKTQCPSISWCPIYLLSLWSDINRHFPRKILQPSSSNIWVP